MVANTPGILPKTALVGSKIVNYPFTIPKQLNDSATKIGEINHALVGGINTAVKTAYGDLQPRGPAKWLLPLFDRIDSAVKHSQHIATRNKTAFWDPFSNGMAQVGQAFGGPGAYWYARKAGIEEPTAQTIQNALAGGLFHFPTAEELQAGGEAALGAAIEAQPDAIPEGTAQAAEGAGQVGAAA